MTITIPQLTFTDGQSTVPASWLNAVNDELPKAPDFSGGGTYAPTAPIIIPGNRFQLSGTSNIALASRSITRHQTMLGYTESGNWTVRPYGTWRNTAVGGTVYLSLDDLPAGGTLTAIHLRWAAAGGHGGLPTLPSFGAFQVDQDGTTTSLGTGTDPSATVGAYELVHDISLTGLTHTIDRPNTRYWLTVTGETGGFFVANAEAVSLRAVVTATQYYEW